MVLPLVMAVCMSEYVEVQCSLLLFDTVGATLKSEIGDVCLPCCAK